MDEDRVARGNRVAFGEAAAGGKGQAAVADAGDRRGAAVINDEVQLAPPVHRQVVDSERARVEGGRKGGKRTARPGRERSRCGTRGQGCAAFDVGVLQDGARTTQKGHVAGGGRGHQNTVRRAAGGRAERAIHIQRAALHSGSAGVTIFRRVVGGHAARGRGPVGCR